MSEMPAVPPQEVAEAFTTAAITALQELARVDALAEPGPPARDALPDGQVVLAAICLQRPVPGSMTLILCAEVAGQLAARYLPEGTALTVELIDDVAGEFANVIAGQAKTILKGTSYHFTMSTPVVCRAASLAQIRPTLNVSLAASLASELGRVLLLVDLPLCPNV